MREIEEEARVMRTYHADSLEDVARVVLSLVGVMEIEELRVVPEGAGKAGNLLSTLLMLSSGLESEEMAPKDHYEVTLIGRLL